MEINIQETSKNTLKKVVGTQISHDLYHKLKLEAETDFMSISDLLRKIIYLYYKNQQTANETLIESQIRKEDN